MQKTELLAYVDAAARLVGLQLDTARAKAVALHLGRTAALAQALEDVTLPVEDEPAEVYCPAPYPQRESDT